MNINPSEWSYMGQWHQSPLSTSFWNLWYTPDFVPAMRKARAVVTDRGGITSHAAIISRELNIPCVVGTGIATELFKDGDRIEVDAVKGIARKLKPTPK